MQKTVYHEGLDTDVVVARRKGSRNIRISIKSDGTLRVSVPYGVSDAAAWQFVESKQEWIRQRLKPKLQLEHDMHIGKAHRIEIKTGGDSPRSRIANGTITITVPESLSITSPDVQKVLERACDRALQKEAQQLLPQRLETLAKKHSVSYRSCTVKKLRSRWGACDNRNNIQLNIYLMQLPWALIDYVILHELAHTKHAHHQKPFWDYFEQLLPDAKERRKRIKTYTTAILPTAY